MKNEIYRATVTLSIRPLVSAAMVGVLLTVLSLTAQMQADQQDAQLLHICPSATKHAYRNKINYDLRDSPNPGDPAVYYASSNTSGVAYPAFSQNVKVSDVGHQPNCLTTTPFGIAFNGDYIEAADSAIR